MLIAVCSLKGSPGVTTWAMALAAGWPRPARVVLVECDPSGGSVGVRCGLPPAPGLGSLAAAAHRDPTAGLLWSHTQTLPSGCAVVTAPPGADYTRAALHTLLDSRRQTVSVLRSAALNGAVVIADCGRLDSTSPAMSVAREADQVLLLARPVGDELANLAADLEMVDLWSMRPGLLLAGPGYSADEVAHALGVPVLGSIPHDPKGLCALCGHSRAGGAARSRLGRAGHRLATRLTTPLSAPPGTAAGTGAALWRPGHERAVEHTVEKGRP